MAKKIPPTNPTITPTGNCFDEAIEYFDMIDPGALMKAEIADQYRVVHAACRGHATGVLFAHAWVEHMTDTAEHLAWQGGMLRGERVYFALPAEQLYSTWAVRWMNRYTLPEVAREMVERSGWAGPWDPGLACLCGSGGAIVGKMEGPAPLMILRYSVLARRKGER